MPVYLRFLRGVIDTEDLPLNISREILQQNQVLSKIKKNSVKKILSEFKKLSKNKEKYATFFNEYGKLIKEGIYQDFENRDDLLELVRYKSTKSNGLASFNEYVKNMNKLFDKMENNYCYPFFYCSCLCLEKLSNRFKRGFEFLENVFSNCIKNLDREN